MARDIEKIVEEVRRLVPAVQVVQMHKCHPADDDGLWWFRLPGLKPDIQIESSTGNCPFLIENTLTQTRLTAKTVEEVVDAVTSYLRSLR